MANIRLILLSVFLVIISLLNSFSQTVIPINLDTIVSVIPGTKGVAFPKIIKVGLPTIKQNGLASKLVVTPRVSVIKPSETKIITFGINNIPLPIKRQIPKKGFLVQQGDTIYAPTIKIAGSSPIKQALPLRSKDVSSYSIQYLDVEQALPSPYVRSIIEDKNGNLWFATSGGGASRYDGKSITTFTEKEGLSSNYIYSIFEDSKGNIWFGTWYGGVCKYDGKYITNFTQKQGLAGDIVMSIIEDKSGKLWFATEDGGVSCYDGESFTNFTEKEGLADNMVSSIIEDKSGNLWFATKGGLSCYDGKSFTNFTKEDGLANTKFLSSYIDKSGKLWFGSLGGGVSCYEGKSFTTFTEKEGLVNNSVRSIFEDKGGNLWFGTNGGGLSRFDGEYFTDFTEKEGLSNNRILSIMEDKSGTLWFGTDGGGVNCYNWKSFTSFTTEQGLPHGRVWSIEEDKDKNLWFGTDKGASYFDGETFANFTKKQGLPEGRVFAIKEAKNSDVWFGTRSGVSQLSKNKGSNFKKATFTNFTSKEGLAESSIWSILEDKCGNVWFGSYGGGVSRYDGKSFTTFTKKEGLLSNNIRAMIEDRSGNFWIGTDKGVSFYDGKSLVNFIKDENISNININAIFEDNNRNIWFATSKTLSVLLYNSSKSIGERDFLHYTIADGLPHNIILSITQDAENRFWLGTENGNTTFIFPKNTRKKNPIHFQNFFTADGLQSPDAMPSSILHDSKNRVWWGMATELSVLDLNKFEFSEQAPNIQFLGLDINETFVEYNLLNENRKEYNSSLSNSDKIVFTEVVDFYNYPLNLELSYNLNHLTFYFSAIDWAAPHKLEYQYKLEGLDTDWSKRMPEISAEYRNLSSGTFIFKVRAIGVAGKWSKTFEYKFIIHPPWWQTWWAYVLYSLILITIVLIIIKLNIQRLQQQKDKLEKTVKQRTSEIETQKEEIETQAEELESSLENIQSLTKFKDELTQMLVHDLKNPISAIINLPKGISESEQKNLTNYSAHKMLNLVMNILDVRKYEDSQLKLEKIEQDISTLWKNAKQQLNYLAVQKNIKIVELQNQEINTKADKELIERVFINILSNSLKYTNANGKIKFYTEKTKNETIKVIIEDNGIGISEKNIETVFKKYGQSGGKFNYSTGLGLTFCKIAIEEHGGEIGIESEEQKGTKIWFILPNTIIVGKKIEVKTSENKILIEKKEELKKFLPLLRETDIYQISSLKKIVKAMKKQNLENEAWVKSFDIAVRSCNNEQYESLLNNLEKA